MMHEKHRRSIESAASLLREAERPVRLLRSLAWPVSAKQEFFRTGARELPQVTYPSFDPAPTMNALAEARRIIDGPTPVRVWLERVATAIENGAGMLSAVGTRRFFEHAGEAYGTPTGALPNGLGTALDLARRFDTIISRLKDSDTGAPPPACYLAEQVAASLREAVGEHFGADAPSVTVVDELSANAVAGPRSIRVRRDACFNDRDLDQLVQHEAFVHVGTSLNGLAQESLPILAAGHAGCTRTQEGLAVFAEFVSGAMDTDRLHRLADRVVAIQMAVEGADFVQVYAYFLGRTGNEEQAFENTRRVFRGGPLRGGAPFTKDIVYLDGFVRVHSFLDVAVAAGRIDSLRLLFCGKLDIEDIPALSVLSAEGLCRAPRFLPPWAADLRFLVAFLAYSSFLGRVPAGEVDAHCSELLDACPVDPHAGGSG